MKGRVKKKPNKKELFRIEIKSKDELLKIIISSYFDEISENGLFYQTINNKLHLFYPLEIWAGYRKGNCMPYEKLFYQDLSILGTPLKYNEKDLENKLKEIRGKILASVSSIKTV